MARIPIANPMSDPQEDPEGEPGEKAEQESRKRGTRHATWTTEAMRLHDGLQGIQYKEGNWIDGVEVGVELYRSRRR